MLKIILSANSLFSMPIVSVPIVNSLRTLGWIGKEAPTQPKHSKPPPLEYHFYIILIVLFFSQGGFQDQALQKLPLLSA